MCVIFGAGEALNQVANELLELGQRIFRLGDVDVMNVPVFDPVAQVRKLLLNARAMLGLFKGDYYSCAGDVAGGAVFGLAMRRRMRNAARSQTRQGILGYWTCFPRPDLAGQAAGDG